MGSIYDIEYSIGEKVTYVTPYKREKGMIKSYPINNPIFLFVVFNCNDDWDNFLNYTSVLTNKKDLIKGWDENSELESKT